ncbi:MAG: hypothetical protein QGD94_07855 [Planctomycetia bacterium]|nr:hypothetical protein [Planctomycetia bacterium]
MIRYLILGGAVLTTMGYGRSFMFGVPPTGLPPMAQVPLSLYGYFIGLATGDKRRTNWHKRQLQRSALTFVPGYYTYRDIKQVVTGEKEPWSMFFYEDLRKREPEATPEYLKSLTHQLSFPTAEAKDLRKMNEGFDYLMDRGISEEQAKDMLISRENFPAGPSKQRTKAVRRFRLRWRAVEARRRQAAGAS